jgi:hypothetical protein
MEDDTKWTTVSYMPPFYGNTPFDSTTGVNDKIGAYPGNPNSYGMWFTPPDVGVTVVCIFLNGDRSQGFYIGAVPEQGLGNMYPAIASSTKYDVGNENQKEYFAGATRLPVTEININNEEVFNDPRFFEKTKGGKMSTTEEFLSSFMAVGTNTSVRCICGKIHFNANPRGWHDDEVCLQNFKNLTKKDQRYKEHNNTISYFAWGNDYIVWGCPCKSDEKLEGALWKHRDRIISFLKKKTEKAKRG